MIRIRRRSLALSDQAELQIWQQSVTDCCDGAPEIEAKWRTFTGTPLRKRVSRRLQRQSWCKCVYCEDGRIETIDHFYPKQRYPQRAFQWENFNGACFSCNLRKGRTLTLVAERPLLLNPMEEETADFFYIQRKTGEVVPAPGLSDLDRTRAQATCDRFRLNSDTLARRRRRIALHLEAALELFRESPTTKTENAVLNALHSQGPLLAVLRQMIRKPDPEIAPAVHVCIESSRRVRRYLRALKWI